MAQARIRKLRYYKAYLGDLSIRVVLLAAWYVPWILHIIELLLRLEVEETNGKFRYEFDGTEILMSDILHFSEVLWDKPLRGYSRRYSPETDDIVVDVGAFPGDFTIYAAKRARKVIAIEPDAENAEALRENVELNDLDNVEVINRAVWSENATLEFSTDQVIGLTSRVQPNGPVKVPAMTLDWLLNSRDVDEVDFVKMDVEGAEIEALEGCEETLISDRPSFAIATYHVRSGELTAARVERFFERREYDVVTEYPRHLTTYAAPENEGL